MKETKNKPLHKFTITRDEFVKRCWKSYTFETYEDMPSWMEENIYEACAIAEWADKFNAINIAKNINRIDVEKMAREIKCAECDIDFCNHWRNGKTCYEVKEIMKLINIILNKIKEDNDEQ